MQIDQIIYSNALFLFLFLPALSIVFIFPSIFLPKAKIKIERYQYQSTVIKILFLLIITRAVGMTITLQATNEVIQQAGQVLALIIPTIIYTIITFKACQRLAGMGYSRFFGILCAIPLLGPVMIFFLYMKVHERK